MSATTINPKGERSMANFKLTNPWARNPWFETVHEAQRRAKQRLPKSVYSSLVAGTQAGITVNDNVDAFAKNWAVWLPLGSSTHLPVSVCDTVTQISTLRCFSWRRGSIPCGSKAPPSRFGLQPRN